MCREGGSRWQPKKCILEDSLIRANRNGPLHYPENTELWLGYSQIIGAPITKISAQLTK